MTTGVPPDRPRGTTDDVLRRVERRARLLAIAATAIAGVVPGGGLAAAEGVAGGALLATVSYVGIRRGVTGLADRVLARLPPASEVPAPNEEDGPTPVASSSPPWKTPRGAGLFVLRYALLALMAYVMIARLHLSPIGLLCGASVVMLAVAAELIRSRP